MRRLTLTLGLLVAGCGAEAPPEDDPLRAQVETSTGWKFDADPEYEFVSREELVKRSLPDASRARAFERLGLLPSGYDLSAGLGKAVGRESLGHYDPASGKILLLKEAKRKPPAILHELIHALQHQRSGGLKALKEASPDLGDVQAAFQALIEGEAALHSIEIAGAKPEELALKLRVMDDVIRERLKSDPPLVRRLSAFHRMAGARYILIRRQGAGVAGTSPAVHRALPLSTEYLLHPERRPHNDPPVGIYLPDLSAGIGGGRKLAQESVFGEALLTLLLSDNPVGPASALEETLLWDGDRVQLYEKPGGSDTVVVLLSHWDTAGSALAAHARFLGRNLMSVWAGKDVAVVAGLPKVDAHRVAMEALGRVVRKPFQSLKELRNHRKGLKFPVGAMKESVIRKELTEALRRQTPGTMSRLRKQLTADPLICRLVFLEEIEAVPGGGRLDPDLEKLDWAVKDVARFARAGYLPSGQKSPLMPKLLEAYGRDGAGWPDGVVASVVEYAAEDRERLAAFLGRYEDRPGVMKHLVPVFPTDASKRLMEHVVRAIRKRRLLPGDFPGSWTGWHTAQRKAFFLAHLETLAERKVVWSRKEQEQLVTMITPAGVFDAPAGSVQAAIDKLGEKPLVLHIALRGLRGPEKDAARKFLKAHFSLLLDPDVFHAGRLARDPDVALTFLDAVLGYSFGPDRREAVNRFAEDVLAKGWVDSDEARTRMAAALPTTRLDAPSRARMFGMTVFHPKFGETVLSSLESELKAGTLGEEVKHFVNAWSETEGVKKLPYYEKFLNSILDACLYSPQETKPVVERLALHAADLGKFRIWSVIRSLRKESHDALGIVAASAIRAHPEWVRDWEKEILEIPEGLSARTFVERELLEQKGELDRAMDRLVTAFRSGRTDYPAELVGRLRLTDEQRDRFVIACIEGVRTVPGGYVWKADETPRRMLFLHGIRKLPEEALPTAWQMWNRNRGNSGVPKKAALSVLVMVADGRVAKFLIDNYDTVRREIMFPSASLALEKIFERIIEKLPDGDRTNAAYWRRLYGKYEDKLPDQLP